MQKVYSRINWINYPSEDTPLNATNLNRIDYAVDEIDNRVIELDTSSLTQEQASNLIRSIAIDDDTGVMTITRYNGAIQTIQTLFNQVAIDFDYNVETQMFVITLQDGTKKPVDLSAVITQNEFGNTSTIYFNITDGTVYANILEHSIGDEHLRTDYLSDIRVSEANAATSETNAENHSLDSEAWAVGQRAAQDVDSTDDTYRNNSLWHSLQSKSWAIGETGNRTGENEDNAKFYAEAAATLKSEMEELKSQAEGVLEQATARLTGLNFMLNYADGCLYYDINVGIDLQIDATTGNLMWEVIT